MPQALRSLADLAGWGGNDSHGAREVDPDTLYEWARRWNLRDRWCLDTARATVEVWLNPTWQMVREECALGGRDWRDEVDWTYQVAVVADPLDDDALAIPLDPFFFHRNPRF